MTRRYLARRLLQIVPTAAGIVLAAFLLVEIAPGDSVLALAGEHGNAEYYEFMRDKFGLDEPLPERFTAFAGNLVTGDLGRSYTRGRPVMDMIAERLPNTLLLAGSALVLSTAGGIALALFATSRRRRLRDLSVSGATLTVYAMPVFWSGQLALLFFAAHLGWFPIQGMTTAGSDASGLSHAFDVAHHLALPALVLALQEVAAVTRLTRAGLFEELESDHVRTARAKGLPESIVRRRHALRRALLPVATVVGARAGHIFTGAVIVEVVFGWPGIGRLLLDAVQVRDTPVLLGIFLIVAFAVVVVNLVTDLVYAWLDPRVRYH